MNWGRGLALALIAFAALMAWFVVKASQSPEPLVTEHYYDQELAYQGRIDDMQRANALSSPVIITMADGGLRLTFPPELKGQAITGKLTLLRPNDPDRDRVLPITADPSGTFSSGDMDLLSGRYNASLEWRVGKDTYYTEEKLIAP
ncbi:MAG: FixH family protein [Flavobacteriales bacterium]